jgi:hypothetical protein
MLCDLGPVGVKLGRSRLMGLIMDGFERLYSGEIHDRLEPPGWEGCHGPSLPSRTLSRGFSDRGPVGMFEPRVSDAADFEPAGGTVWSVNDGRTRKFDPNDDLGPEGTLSGNVLPTGCAMGVLTSGFCSTFLGNSSVGALPRLGAAFARDGWTGGSNLGLSWLEPGFWAFRPASGARSAFGPLGGWKGAEGTAGDTDLAETERAMGGFSVTGVGFADGGGP